MSADTLLAYTEETLFLLVFLVTTAKAIRQPRRATIDTAVLFGVLQFLVADSLAITVLHVPFARALAVVDATLVMALPYLLLRLVDGFSPVPLLWKVCGLVGLGLSAATFVVTQLLALPKSVVLVLACYIVIYFAVLALYVALAFVRAERYANGVTRRRMYAVGAGSLCLGLILVLASVQATQPALAGWCTVLRDLCTLGAGISFFMGFAPPRWLRHAWQEPELRAFLAQMARLPYEPTTPAIVAALEQGAAAALGAPEAAIGLWDETERLLRFPTSEQTIDPGAKQTISGRVFVTQSAIFSEDIARDAPLPAAQHHARRAGALVAVPVTAGEHRLGVLMVHATRPTIFAEDDLVLAQLLADQAAAIIKSQALLQEAARGRAREEALRLKDDFLSSAAHELKTPLTILIAQTQLLEQRAERNPTAPVDVAHLHGLGLAVQRLHRLVLELLDIARIEHGRLVSQQETVDLLPVLREVCARHTTARHRFVITAPASVVGSYDATRLMQLFENLCENATKYSPEGGEVCVRVWQAGDEAHLSFGDSGIGIPAADLPHLFDRFHRGSNVDDRRFAGMGLGLYICRSIAEQHGGRLWAVSDGPGQGSTFHVVLPMYAEGLAHAEDSAGTKEAMSVEMSLRRV